MYLTIAQKILIPRDRSFCDFSLFRRRPPYIPNRRRANNGGRRCRICNELGHLARDCPHREEVNKVEESSEQVPVESAASAEGQAAPVAEQVAEPSEQAAEPSAEKSEKPEKSEKLCRICNKPGHMARNCPERRNEQ